MKLSNPYYTLFYTLLFITMIHLAFPEISNDYLDGNYDNLSLLEFYDFNENWFILELILLSSLAIIISMTILRQFLFIKNNPLSKIRSAAQGFVEIKGKLKQITSIIAPLTGVSCTWFDAEVIKVTKGINKNTDLVFSKTSQVPLCIDDNTGLCYVIPELLSINSTNKKKWSNSKLQIHPLKIINKSREDLLYENGIGSVLECLFNSNIKFKYKEKVLLPDEDIYACGKFFTGSLASLKSHGLSNISSYEKYFEGSNNFNFLLPETNSDLPDCLSNGTESGYSYKLLIKALIYVLIFAAMLTASFHGKSYYLSSMRNSLERKHTKKDSKKIEPFKFVKKIFQNA